MDIRIIILGLDLFFYFALGQVRNTTKAKNRFVWFSCFLLALHSGLRHICIGPDTSGYYGFFMNSMTKSWADVFSLFTSELSSFRDPGYSVVEKAFSSLIPSWQLYLLSLAFFYYYAMGRLWQRYIDTSEGVLLANVLVLSLFSIIALSGIRQQITMALSMLLIPSLENRRWRIVVPAVLFGSLIHISMLFLLLFIPFQFVKREYFKFLIGVSIVLIPVIIFSARSIVTFMASHLGNDYYMGYAESVSEDKPYVYIAICTLLSIFLFINYNTLKNAPSFYLSALVLMTLAFPLIIQDGSMIRIGQYYTIYIMLSIPFVLDIYKDRKLLYCGIVFVLLFFILKTPSVYHFYWESVPGFYY